MRSYVWFGNRTRQGWIPAPRTGMDFSLVRRSTVVQLENGGVYVDDSVAAHREALPEWEGTPDDLRLIRDYYNLVWGPGPFWWVDPFAADTNMLAPNWATPGVVTGGDWPSIHPNTPVATTVASGSLGAPTRAVTYNVSNSSTAAPLRSFTVLIPPGCMLAFSALGSATGSGVVAIRGTSSTGSTSVQTFTPLDPAGSTLWNGMALFPYSSGWRYAEVFLARTGTDASTVTLAGMRLAVTNGQYALSNTFVSGEGAGALRFAGGLREGLISAFPDARFRRKSMSVKLVETGDWD